MKSLLESPGNLLEICSVKFVDTLNLYHSSAGRFASKLTFEVEVENWCVVTQLTQYELLSMCTVDDTALSMEFICSAYVTYSAGSSEQMADGHCLREDTSVLQQLQMYIVQTAVRHYVLKLTML